MRFNPDGQTSPVLLRGFTREMLADVFRELGYTRGAEIGVAGGAYSLALCERIPGLQLACVDPWGRYSDNPRGGPQEQHDRNKRLATERLAPFGATLIQAASMDAVGQFARGSLDFVFIDGHHGFDYVVQDLVEWGRRVREGGIISGHDFYDFKWAGVIEAVTAYTRAHHVEEWFVTDEREPAFFWVKGAPKFPHRGW